MAIKILENIATMGVNYSVIVDDRNDWSSIELEKTFYDKSLKSVYYKDAAGDIFPVFNDGYNNNKFGMRYSEISIDSAGIQTLPSIPQTILDSGELSSDQYFEIDKMILEFSPGTTAFDHTGKNIFINPGSNEVQIIQNSGFFTTISSPVLSICKFGSNSVSSFTFSTAKRASVSVTINMDGIDATEGDGSLLIKTWYQIRTLGPDSGYSGYIGSLIQKSPISGGSGTSRSNG